MRSRLLIWLPRELWKRIVSNVSTIIVFVYVELILIAINSIYLCVCTQCGDTFRSHKKGYIILSLTNTLIALCFYGLSLFVGALNSIHSPNKFYVRWIKSAYKHIWIHSVVLTISFVYTAHKNKARKLQYKQTELERNEQWHPMDANE